MTDDGEKPFLSRWSERKRAVRAEDQAAASERSPEVEEPAAPAADEAELEANRAAAEAIDLDALTEQSDYAPFLRPGVPLALKNAALRKLYRSDPVFAVLDGLNDHDLDYRWPTPGSEVVRTAWKVGRGFLAGEDDSAVEETAAASPAEPPVTTRPLPPAEEPAKAETEGGLPAVETAEAAPRADAVPTEPADAEERSAPPRVGLAQRLDLAAFAKVKREG